jgi:hypothetical protein
VGSEVLPSVISRSHSHVYFINNFHLVSAAQQFIKHERGQTHLPMRHFFSQIIMSQI